MDPPGHPSSSQVVLKPGVKPSPFSHPHPLVKRHTLRYPPDRPLDLHPHPAPASPHHSTKSSPSVDEVVTLSVNRAVSGGLSGAAAMGINVAAFMWLRTVMAFQQVHGSSMLSSVKVLYQQGGIARFYQGIVPALIQGPACRFGDTASNAAAFTFLEAYPQTQDLPVPMKTAVASTASAVWRVVLMPIETVLTWQMVEGRQGLQRLNHKMKTCGVSLTLFQGGAAAFMASIVGHFPWFVTYNYLDRVLEEATELKFRLARNAVIGFLASMVSDTASNAFHVVKICKQASSELLSYGDAARRVVRSDGMIGLFGRGLGFKLLGNGLQGMTFGMLWKVMDDYVFQASPEPHITSTTLTSSPS